MDERGFRYRDENGKLRVAIDANGIGYFDENETSRAVMTEVGIGYRDERGNVVWSTLCGFAPC